MGIVVAAAEFPMMGGPVPIYGEEGEQIGSYDHEGFQLGLSVAGHTLVIGSAAAGTYFLAPEAGGAAVRLTANAVGKAALSRLFGPSGPIFGRARLGGKSIVGGENLRIGWGWRGSQLSGKQVFRISGKWVDGVTGKEDSHIDLYPRNP